jgi:hypothetical protein
MRIALEDVVDQSAWWCKSYQAAFWPAESDPCLQIADYVTWAVQRKYQQQDERSYELIEDKTRQVPGGGPVNGRRSQDRSA